MKLAHILFAAAIVTAPAAFAQDSTVTPPATELKPGGCSVAGSAGCLTPPSGAQPNTSSGSSMEGGTAGSGSGSGTLENTSPGSTLNPGDSSGGSGGTSGGGGAAGPLGNSNPN